ncbi:CTD small phosphatase-like protein [Parasponia andersonii]|uniref:CTD small phosphatase-like protein n=1 Tax=Parasponia andersonii TaxID=3476 RepID=A0A2P5CK88_PARAD|nr:CTD small phosphatase-like protein [Parasponia andersonii]
MEDYTSFNSMSQAPTDQYTPEESSWTMYLEDFWLQNNSDHHQQSSVLISSSACESSLISDAGSSVSNKKLTDKTLEDVNARLNIMNSRRCSRLSFKKRKTKEANLGLDDSLEDTASSPVNSPKVFNLSLLDHVKSKEKGIDQRNNMSEEINGSTSGQIEHERSVCDDQQLDRIGSIESDRYTELKKRGLCLVPLSMLVNYLG